MTIGEIRAHLAWMKANPYKVEKGGNFNGIAAIEALLAREAEVLKTAHPGPRPPLSYPGEGAARLKWRQKRETYRAIRAILKPEENSNG